MTQRLGVAKAERTRSPLYFSPHANTFIQRDSAYCGMIMLFVFRPILPT